MLSRGNNKRKINAKLRIDGDHIRQEKELYLKKNMSNWTYAIQKSVKIVMVLLLKS